MIKNNIQFLTLKTIMQNSIAVMCIKIFYALSNFTITAFLAHILEVKDLGTLAIIAVYNGIFIIISVFGLDTFLIKEIGGNKENAASYLSNAFILTFAVSVASFFLINTIFYFADYPKQIKIAGLAFSLIILPTSISKCIESTFIALGKSWYVTLSTILRETIKFSIVISVLIIYRSIFPVIIAFLASALIGFIINIILANKYLFKLKLVFNIDTFCNMVNVCFVLVLIAGMSNFFLVIDIIVLSKLKDALSVGYYSASYRFITIGFLFIDSVGVSLLPIVSMFYQSSFEQFKSLFEALIKYYLIFIFWYVACVCFFSDKLVFLIFGGKFEVSTYLLKILIWASVFLGGSYFLGKMLYIANLQKYDALVILIACIFNLGFNILFTLKWGSNGTAFATLISSAVLFFLHFYIFSKKVFFITIKKLRIKFPISLFLFFFSFYYISRFNIYAALILSSAIYFYLLLVFQVLKKDEIVMFYNAVLAKEKA